MEELKTRLAVKSVAALGGRPGGVIPASDGSFVAVVDQEAPVLRLVDPAAGRVVRSVELGDASSGPRRLLGRSGPYAYLSDAKGRVARFDLRSGVFEASPRSRGGVVDLAFSTDGRCAWASTAAGDFGAIEFREPGRGSAAARLPLPGRPVPGTLAMDARRGLGAVIVRRQGAAGGLLVVWSALPLRAQFSWELGPESDSLAFSSKEGLLLVSAPESSELLALDVPGGRLVRRTMLLGQAFRLAAELEEAGVWAVCRSVGHLVRADRSLGTVPPPIPLRDVDAAWTRLAFSPEGRLAILSGSPEGEFLLLDTDIHSGSYGTPLDRLEMGRALAGAAWSPLGDEVYVAAGEDLLTVAVDRSDLRLKDTAEYLEQVVRPPASPSPLFPP